MKNYRGTFSCLNKGLSTHHLGVARGTVFQDIRPGAGFKTSDFVKDVSKLGGPP